MTPDDVSQRTTTLIIGGGSAIGAAIVKQFHDEGGAVLATYCNSRVDTLPECDDWLSLDLTDQFSIDKLERHLSARNFRLDNLVFVAGILPGRSLEDYSIAEMDSVMNVNFLGQAKCIKGLLPLLRSPSRIIMMSSISGERGSYDPIYAASKGAVIAFAKSIATWLPPKVRCLAVAPGTVAGSGMYLSMSPEVQKAHHDKTPIRELLTVEKLAKVVVDLTKDHWAHANGSCVRINGGQYV
jgi:3-oxoacyl-[acyl-carrier protein] reductase